MRLTDLPAARALKDHTHLLGLFVQPRSPTEVAGQAGMAPNLVHHHVRKLTELGLLFEQRREGGKVYYQLSALEFRVPWSVLPPIDEVSGELRQVQELVDGFSRAYQTSWLAAGQEEEFVAGFGDGCTPPQPPRTPDAPPVQAFPTHYDALTLRLSPQRYRQLARDLSLLLEEAMQDSLKDPGPACTVAVLAFEGSAEHPAAQWPGRVSRQISSFLGAE